MSLLHREPPVVMNVKKIRRLMDKYGLSCPIRKANPYRRMEKALRTSNVADNLLKRKFRKYGPRMVLLTDITYLPYNGAFAYLSTILDAFTKQILAYVTSPSLEVDFVLETVDILIHNHGAELKNQNAVAQRPGMPLYKLQLYRYIERQQPAAVHVKERELLGQCPAGKLLRPYERRN